MSTPGRPTREQVDADLREVDALATYAPDCAHRLAAEVRALRAELAKVNVEVGRAWLALPHGPHPALHDDSLAGHIRAALVARTPQPAELASVLVSRELLDALVDDGDCWFDHHGGCQEHGYLELEPGEKCPHAEAKELLAAPLPAVPDGEDATCSCCNGDPLTVCAACEQHSCWAGRFMCDESRTAGTKQASPSPNREDDDRPVRWAWAAWLAESAEQADDLDDSERHSLRIAATHLLEDDIAARLNPGDFDPVADPAWALRFTARLWADVETGRAARRVSAPPDGEDAQHHPLTATALREAEQRWQNLPLDEKDRWAAEHDDPRCAFIAAALSTAATRPTGEGR